VAVCFAAVAVTSFVRRRETDFPASSTAQIGKHVDPVCGAGTLSNGAARRIASTRLRAPNAE
jgi:hypothetical protein